MADALHRDVEVVLERPFDRILERERDAGTAGTGRPHGERHRRRLAGDSLAHGKHAWGQLQFGLR